MVQRLGSALVTHGGKTLKAKLGETDDRLSVMDGTIASKVTSSDLAQAQADIVQRLHKPYRLIGKSVPIGATEQYDHFGFMDVNRSGRMYMTCRRGKDHVDKGYVVFSEMQDNGSWSTARTVISHSTYDMRGSAGGTAPNGDIYVAGCEMEPGNGTTGFHDAWVYVSQDDGATFKLVNKVSKPDGADSAILPFGKLVCVGNRWMIPCYSRNNSWVVTLSYLVSTDKGKTWSFYSDSPIFVGEDYNEANMVDCGGGLMYCVARHGSGTVQEDGKGRLHQFVSTDGGLSWRDDGAIVGADGSTEIGWQLITPNLTLVHSKGGTPWVLLTYTARRSSVRYRLARVSDLTATKTAAWGQWFTAVDLMQPESFESGYQSHLLVDNTLFTNVFYTTTNNAVSQARQFQMPIGDLPDYDSGWFTVAQLTNVTKPHGLGSLPSRTEIEFSTEVLGNERLLDCTPCMVQSGSNFVGAGINYMVNLSGYTIRPGTFMAYQTLWGTGGFNPTSGYCRVRAWK